MVIDNKKDIKENVRNSNGCLLISEDMLEQMKSGNLKNKVEMSLPNSKVVDSIINDQVSYADKVSGKILNAANLISKVKKC